MAIPLAREQLAHRGLGGGGVDHHHDRWRDEDALLNVIADAKTKVYGDADPSLTYQVSGGYSSAGRALAWHARGRRFDPV